MRHLPADTHLTGWLDRMGIAYDVVTDHDLHEKGVDILSHYKVVMTGTHPEYHTANTLDHTHISLPANLRPSRRPTWRCSSARASSSFRTTRSC